MLVKILWYAVYLDNRSTFNIIWVLIEKKILKEDFIGKRS